MVKKYHCKFCWGERHQNPGGGQPFKCIYQGFCKGCLELTSELEAGGEKHACVATGDEVFNKPVRSSPQPDSNRPQRSHGIELSQNFEISPKARQSKIDATNRLRAAKAKHAAFRTRQDERDAETLDEQPEPKKFKTPNSSVPGSPDRSGAVSEMEQDS